MNTSVALRTSVTPPLEACTRLFLQGPYGTGKTGLALQRIRWLCRQFPDGRSAPTVIVPSLYVAQEYRKRLRRLPVHAGIPVRILTFNTMARQVVDLAWPAVAATCGFAHPGAEPVFLNLETSQYVLSEWVLDMIHNGKFEALMQNLRFEPSRLVSQILDNLTKASLYQYSLEEAYARLITALPASTDRQGLVNSYQNALRISQRFRRHCLAHGLVDPSLLYELFYQVLGNETLLNHLILKPCRHVIVENCEEQVYACHRLLQLLIPHTDSCVCLADSEAGLRYFLGAYPEGVAAVAQLCQYRYTVQRDPVSGRVGLETRLRRIVNPRPLFPIPPAPCERSMEICRQDPLDRTSGHPNDFFHIQWHEHYAETLAWTANQIQILIRDHNVPPSQIVVLAPNVPNALRFTLQHLLRQRGLDLYSHRPSRKLLEEPAALAVLGLAYLAHPHWNIQLDEIQKRIVLLMSIAGLEGWRGPLLSRDWSQSQYYRFPQKAPAFRGRVGQRNGLRYDNLREWLRTYQHEEQHSPLDIFLARLHDEVLGKAGFRFAQDADAARTARQLVRSAQSYRHIMTEYRIPLEGLDVHHDPGQDYAQLVRTGLIGNLYLPAEGPPADVVELAPVHSFLMRNRTVQHQFWLDANSMAWGQRLHQPLTQPFVLAPSWQGQAWTDREEQRIWHWQLYLLLMGLLRRTRNQVHMGLSTFGPRGAEQKGVLLRVLNQLLMRDSHQATTSP